jgi:L-iditol 2-dehydrogenase
MKAAVCTGLNQMSVERYPDPEVSDPEGMVIRVHTCSVCGSDLRIFHHGNPRVKPPQILGHEIAGEVVAVGANVHRFKVGDRVAVGADVPCGECHWCREGLGNNCKINYAIGYQFQGGYGEYMPLNGLTVRVGPVHLIPDGLSYDVAALAEPLACVINGLEMCRIGLGDTVAVIGAGPAGIMMMRLARSFGATRVIAVQRSRARVEEARRLGGGDEVICSQDGDPIAAVLDLTAGEGADVIITANSSVATHEQALKMARQRGRINLFGGLPAGSPPIEMASNLIHYKELMLTGSHGSVPRQHRLALDLLDKGIIDGAALISHTFPLEDVVAAFAMAEGHAGMKVTVHPQESAGARP